MIRRQNKPFETDEALRASLLSGMTLNSELSMRQGSFLRALGLSAAGESGKKKGEEASDAGA